MKNCNQAINSREYKLILNINQFYDRTHTVERFGNLVESLTQQFKGKAISQKTEEKYRQVYYLDTPNFDLRHHGFILRIRREKKYNQPKYQITLKHRESDRYLSASQDLSATKPGKTKFEEDIIPPFQSKFSQSISVTKDRQPNFENIKQVAKLFPGLKALDITEQTSIELVNNFRAFEVVKKLGNLQFGDKHIVKTDLSFWYLNTTDNLPLIAEFSLKYRLPKKLLESPKKLEQFPMPMIQGTNYLFKALQQQWEWINFHPMTKTAYVYGEGNQFQNMFLAEKKSLLAA
ncbi:CYTH domain-containing protein [Okeania sp. SIO2B3]|uniref:CYTH domain-containing protein n=1 Tax=Okeania sp. SIO2B3 TaxID=2607784 RepID=UPI0013BEE776|nr:CYTH domain-containing protein [Okeania sp. SIO2B3]NET40952.1 CYTH domain-containing protein [Okeania sp. SIO2B3]